jgi:hypothetical protein
MGSSVIRTAARARYLAYTILGAAFTLLFVVVTVRFAIGGEAFETFLLAALTTGLGFQTRRWYRRMRAVGRDGGNEESSHDGTA